MKPIPLGTRTRWGRISAVGTTGGERYYWIVDGNSVAMIPAFMVEEAGVAVTDLYYQPEQFGLSTFLDIDTVGVVIAAQHWDNPLVAPWRDREALVPGVGAQGGKPVSGDNVILAVSRSIARAPDPVHHIRELRAGLEPR